MQINQTELNDIVWDLIVIGGGINGVGIANDAAGRGLKVLLCEQGDLASATSSASTKLIHGGLRYLEYYEFRLVKEALAEREVLLNKSPHIMWPLRFYLPHQASLRPAWLIRLGLFLYDHLAKRDRLPASKFIRFDKNSVLKPNFKKGFEYSDVWVDDARLVVLNAMSAAQKGATVLTRHQCVKASPLQSGWQVQLADLTSEHTPKLINLTAKALVNAAGPWVENLFGQVFEQTSPQAVRLVKGSHIIVPKIHQQEQAYILQHTDKRIVFVIPYEQDFSLIGTTDVDYQGDPAAVNIDQNEIEYLLTVVNQHFNCKLGLIDIVHTYSGVRPLIASAIAQHEHNKPNHKAQAVSRDYHLELSKCANNLPLLSVFGGKITTYRKLAQSALDKLSDYFPNINPCISKTEILPGGDFNNHNELQKQLESDFNYLPKPMLKRFVRSYGTLSYQILADVKQTADLGRCFAQHFYQIELDYLIQNEWAQTLEDVIWRRTKLGLRLNNFEKTQIQNYLTSAIY
ncbi:glycerol-3-phosphate dehydrogenase [Catenovulum sp. 2E275]|uniref:glycerol-3-phosphate dehydrogenase n=1 Tax=Catenovulum sp. 2E275 TaxID=2980497 RepID=UPI0021CE2BE5|nr:glycerol-3-phosphate dehydrogenase [Catenovulum sp. 2E275]MCU4675171.1 glycerol-3-phosphate dehydrogenase [Catenovulum sp. 2E275]